MSRSVVGVIVAFLVGVGSCAAGGVDDATPAGTAGASGGDGAGATPAGSAGSSGTAVAGGGGGRSPAGGGSAGNSAAGAGASAPAAGSGGSASGGNTGGAGRGSAGGAAGGASGGNPGTGGSPPTPPPGWTNVTGNLAGMASECGNVSTVSAKPNSAAVTTDVAQHGLWSSTDGSGNWTKMGEGAGSAVITNRTSAIVYDPMNPDIFWESGIYNSGGVYQTTNGGMTFTKLGNIAHIDLVSIDFTDPMRQTLLAGGHEAPKLGRSSDGGKTWTEMGAAIGGGNVNFPLVLDAQTHVVGSWGGGSGIFRTTNGGGAWTRVFTGAFRSHPLLAADGTIYWLLEGTAGMVKSTDKGATWTKVGPAGMLSGGEHGPIELPDHRIVAIGRQSLMASKDQGATWARIGPAMLPYGPWGVVYSAVGKALYVWHFSCAAPVPTDAIMRAGFDYKVE